MRIHVLGDDTISSQARTYAEYRVFAALAQSAGTEQVRGVRVVIRRARNSHGRDDVTCTVSVAFEGSSSLRIRSTGDHPYAAINSAVERLRSANGPERIDWPAVQSG